MTFFWQNPAGSLQSNPKAIRLTAKEIARADSGYTIITRPQSGGGYRVMAVRIHGTTGLPVDSVFARNKAEVPAAARDIARWLDKLGFPGKMGGASRERQKNPRVRRTQAEYIADIDWNIRDATEALNNAVGLKDWRGVKKYADQITALEHKRWRADALGEKRRGRETGSLLRGSGVPAGWKYGYGKLP